jgi:hypothetical protein
MKFIKPFSSFKYCMNSNNSTKNMWRMALRDPAYLFLISMCVGITVYCVYLFMVIF